MQSENRIFDDFAKVLNGAAGTFAEAAKQLTSTTYRHHHDHYRLPHPFGRLRVRTD